MHIVEETPSNQWKHNYNLFYFRLTGWSTVAKCLLAECTYRCEAPHSSFEQIS